MKVRKEFKGVTQRSIKTEKSTGKVKGTIIHYFTEAEKHQTGRRQKKTSSSNLTYAV